VLVIVMMTAALLLIALTVVLPSVYQEGQREREEEAIFRGTQYARAVARFRRQFNRFPVSMKELLQTNGMRFLRKEYTDPLDPKGKWRIIHVNAGGVLLDSKNQPLSNNPNSPNNPAGLGQSTPGMTGLLSSAPGQGGQPIGFGGLGSSSPAGGAGQTSFGPTSSFFGTGNEIQGAFIAGVAPTSHHTSIKVWNKHYHYDEWEFLGTDLTILGLLPGMAGSLSASPGAGSGLTGPRPGPAPGPIGSTPPPRNF
jgi:type II secretory pathway pseudopilin PulG